MKKTFALMLFIAAIASCKKDDTTIPKPVIDKGVGIYKGNGVTTYYGGSPSTGTVTDTTYFEGTIEVKDIAEDSVGIDITFVYATRSGKESKRLAYQASNKYEYGDRGSHWSGGTRIELDLVNNTVSLYSGSANRGGSSQTTFEGKKQ